MQIQKSSFLKEYIDTTAKLSGLSIVMQNRGDFPESHEELLLDGRYWWHWSGFCTLIKSSPCDLRKCGTYEAAVATKARSAKIPFTTTCRCGVVDVHIPVWDKEEYLGSIVCGQVFMRKPDAAGFERVLRVLDKKTTLNVRELREVYFASPYISEDALADIIHRMELLARYIVEVHEKNKLSRMMRKHDVDGMDTCDVKSRDEYVAKKAIDFIRKNYSKDISRDDVSRVLYLNPSYFSRLFKKAVGKSFTDYLINTRLEKAKQLLGNPLLAIKDIAVRVGFADQYYFSRIFRKREGVPPTAARNCVLITSSEKSSGK